MSLRRVRPRPPFSWWAPWGPPDPRDAPGRTGSPLAPPFPDLAVASGRRAVPALRAVKRASGGRTFTVVLKDPRLGPGAADLVWVPEHDGLRGPNVLSTLTGPHRVSAARLARARSEPDGRLAVLARPRVAVLVGGDSRHHRFTAADRAALLAGLRRLREAGAALMLTASRRTPPELASALPGLAAPGPDGPAGYAWDGTGPSPLVAMLALADAIVVTADSANMLDEAVATGAPVLAFSPSGGHPKLDRHLAGLVEYGAVRPFRGRLEAFRYEPLDTTPLIAEAVRDALARLRGDRPPAPGRSSE